MHVMGNELIENAGRHKFQESNPCEEESGMKN